MKEWKIKSKKSKFHFGAQQVASNVGRVNKNRGFEGRFGTEKRKFELISMSFGRVRKMEKKQKQSTDLEAENFTSKL